MSILDIFKKKKRDQPKQPKKKKVKESKSLKDKLKEVFELDEEGLKKIAESSCDRCYGRGHRGYNVTHKQFEICSCVVRTLRKETDKEKSKVKN